MQGKLKQLMKHEGVNSTRLAEILGIQASGISHIMSGRNKPSYDFLLKLLQRFPQINPDWLLLDRGPMYRDEIKNARSGAATTGRAEALLGSAVISGGSVNSLGDSVATLGGPVNPSDGKNTARGHFGGLFAPDNNDIISPETPQNGTQNGLQSGGQDMGQNGARGGASQDTGQGVSSASAARVPLSQNPVYQAGGFTRSSAIERIVVFYRDKTFSEYQPENLQ